jgi:hypothetical protein
MWQVFLTKLFTQAIPLEKQSTRQQESENIQNSGTLGITPIWLLQIHSKIFSRNTPPQNPFIPFFSCN